ncbi:MAG: Mth938-like domain-containing protein [Sphingomonadaceae bacterium]|nr:Mth938-like domain-containing protein [Sphingomonadaceae bacterium]
MPAFTPDDKPAGRIDGFVGRGFRIGDRASAGGIIVHARAAIDWEPGRVEDLAPDHFAQVPPCEILLLGTGAALKRPPRATLAALAARGIAVEFMDSRAAARTFNLLLAEGREVVAALLPL